MGRILGVSQSKVHRTLKKNKFHPYHFTPVQDLKTQDYPLRINFARIILRRHENEEGFLDKILWTDESIFTRDGIFNCHNSHFWAQENPHLAIVKKSQDRFSVMVWAGVKGKSIIGPHFFRETLTGARYTNFLAENYEELLEVVPENEREDLIFMQDGAPGHFSILARNWLNQNYRDRWIGRGGPIAWPPRSPDMTPMDFFVWGYLKEFVYSVRIDTMEQLENRIHEGFRNLRVKMNDINLSLDIIKRFNTCIEQNGGHFENFL